MNPEFLNRAIVLSRQGMEAGEGGPFGAVVVHNNQIIGEGHNSVIATNDPTNHAEMVAIRAATTTLGSFDLNGCELYVNAEPCPMCLGAIYWAGLGGIFFANTRGDVAEIGFDDSRIYKELSTPPGERSIPAHQVTSPEAAAVFAEWMNREDRIQY